MHLAFKVLLLTGLMLTSSIALADDEARARELFAEGRDAMTREDYATACDKFEQSVQLFRRASMLLNLGACNDKLGKLGTALRYWREGVSAMQIDDPRMATAKGAVADLEQRAPRIAVSLPEGLPAEALVAVDGEAVPIAQLAAPLYVDPGEHVLTLDAPGHMQSRVTVTTTIGRMSPVQLALGDALTPDVVTVTESSPTQLVVGWVLAGVGAAGLVMGAVTGGLVLDRKATVEELCSDDICSDQAGADAADEGRTLAVLSTVGFIAGAALVGVGVVLIVTVSEPTVALHISPNGVVLTGRF